MNIEARKYHMIEQIMKFSEEELDKIEAFLEEEQLDPRIEEEMTVRALQAEKDIEEGRVRTLDEAENRINRLLGL